MSDTQEPSLASAAKSSAARVTLTSPQSVPLWEITAYLSCQVVRRGPPSQVRLAVHARPRVPGNPSESVTVPLSAEEAKSLGAALLELAEQVESHDEARDRKKETR